MSFTFAASRVQKEMNRQPLRLSTLPFLYGCVCAPDSIRMMTACSMRSTRGPLSEECGSPKGQFAISEIG